MASKAPKAKISTERAQDWSSSVLNPIIEGLRRELHLLPKPLRWLHETRDFEYLHSVRSYVIDVYVDNHEDFVAKHPKLRPEFRKHDEALADLRAAVSESYDQLASDPAFQSALVTATQGKNFRDIDYRYFMSHIVGGYLELQPIYDRHDVYNALAISLRDPPQLSEQKTRRIGDVRKLRAIDEALHDQLVELRTEIADRYGARIQPVD